MCLSSQFPISISVIQFPTPAHVITAVHSSCALNVDPLILKSPPSVAPRPVGSFIWMPFDRPEHALGHGKDDNDFNKDDTCRMTASIPKCANSSMSPQVMVKYYLHRHGQDDSILAGSSVLSRESICPPFESCPNQNLFQQFLCHMNGTNLDSTYQCLVVHLPCSSIRSIRIFCTCAMQTAKSFRQISLLLRWPQSRHSLIY